MSSRIRPDAKVGLLLLALPVAALGALGPRYGGDLTVGLPELPASLEPSPALGAERLVSGLVHETLVGVAPEGFPVPALARGFASAAGGREWTLTLREGARFHDDRPVGAGDALSALRRFLRSATPAAARLSECLDGGPAFRTGSTEELPGLTAPDTASLVLRLTEPRPVPLTPLASPAAAVTSPRGAGAGPFIPTVHVPGRRFGLTAFGGHVRGRPYLDRVQLVAISDAPSLAAELHAGRVDAAPAEGGAGPLAATLLLVLDPGRAPFDSAASRAAVASAIDRADLVKHLLPGGDSSAALLAPSLLPPLGSSGPPSRARLGGSVAMAVGRDVPPLVSQRIVAHLSALGLAVRVVPAGPSAVASAPAPARLLLWSPEVPEAGLALRELATLAPAPLAAREALAAAELEADLDRRRAQLHRAEAALRADRVLLPLATVPSPFAVRSGVHGASVDLAGRLRLEDAWVEP